MSRLGNLSEILRRCLRRFPLLPALLLSLFLHFLVFGGWDFIPDWSKPEPEIRMIHARIAANSQKSAEAPAAKPKKPKEKPPQPKQEMQPPETPAPNPFPIPDSSADALLSEEGQDMQLQEGEEDDMPWPDIPSRYADVREELESRMVERWLAPRYMADNRAFPPEGEIEYRMYRGEVIEIGAARFSWALWQRTYRFSMTMQTSGLVALIRDAKVEMESSGIMMEKFYPLRYQIRRNGRVTETNYLDWSDRTLSMESRKVRKATVLPMRYETQDLLSLYGQLPFWVVEDEIRRAEEEEEAEEETETTEKEEAAQREEGTEEEAKTDWQAWTKTLWLTTGTRYEPVHIVVVGEEFLGMADRLWTTRHFRVSGRMEIDLWLAKELYWLPVQIRYRDRDDVYEQRMERYKLYYDPEEAEPEETEPEEEEQP
ncbi:MAG: DUF3108 domain-containing protein [Zoogloeaceae bacterium]|jgi:hypothetical protein|nr:DUF3108 domain-containing protein [Zoogloeaceae bacterium]